MEPIERCQAWVGICGNGILPLDVLFVGAAYQTVDASTYDIGATCRKLQTLNPKTLTLIPCKDINDRTAIRSHHQQYTSHSYDSLGPKVYLLLDLFAHLITTLNPKP